MNKYFTAFLTLMLALNFPCNLCATGEKEALTKIEGILQETKKAVQNGPGYRHGQIKKIHEVCAEVNQNFCKGDHASWGEIGLFAGANMAFGAFLAITIQRLQNKP